LAPGWSPSPVSLATVTNSQKGLAKLGREGRDIPHWHFPTPKRPLAGTLKSGGDCPGPWSLGSSPSVEACPLAPRDPRPWCSHPWGEAASWSSAASAGWAPSGGCGEIQAAGPPDWESRGEHFVATQPLGSPPSSTLCPNVLRSPRPGVALVRGRQGTGQREAAPTEEP
jgi:hypothetical protein